MKMAVHHIGLKLNDSTFLNIQIVGFDWIVNK